MWYWMTGPDGQFSAVQAPIESVLGIDSRHYLALSGPDTERAIGNVSTLSQLIRPITIWSHEKHDC